jgi:hypothetical protein
MYLCARVLWFYSSHAPINPSGCLTRLRVWHAITNPIPLLLFAPDGDRAYKGNNFHYNYYFGFVYITIKPLGVSSWPLWAMIQGPNSTMNYTSNNACGKPPPYRLC